MNVFVSFSKARSERVANSVANLIQSVFRDVSPPVQPLLSNRIEAGKKWPEALAKQLRGSAFGVICLTRENLRREWIQFEAGALSNAVGFARVVPLKIDPIRNRDMPRTLRQYQSVDANKEGIRKLLASVQEGLQADQRLSGAELSARFDVAWPSLSADLLDVQATTPKARDLVFYVPSLRGNPFFGELLDEMIQTIKRLDPDRPVYIRNGAITPAGFASDARNVVATFAKSHPWAVVLMVPEQPSTYVELFGLNPLTPINLIALDILPENQQKLNECKFLRKVIVLDNAQAARNAVEMVVEAAKGLGTINCLVCDGDFHQRGLLFLDELRRRAAADGFVIHRDRHAKLRFANARENAFNWTKARIAELSTEIASYPTFIFAANDSMALGIRSALEKAELDSTVDVRIVSFDATDRVRKYVKEGDRFMWASMDQNYSEYARRGVMAALNMLDGKPVGSQVEYIEPEVVRR